MRKPHFLGGFAILALSASFSQASSESYKYDPSGRLIAVVRATSKTTYSLDPSDNRIQIATALSGTIFAGDDFVSTGAGVAVTFDPRENDTVGIGESISVVGVGSGASGSVTFNGSSITYSPTPGFSGSDEFTYTASNGTVSSTGKVTVVVSSTNRAPVATPDRVRANPGQTIQFDPRVNDVDPDGNAFAIVAIGAPKYGQASVVGGATIEYIPDNGFSGRDLMQYTVGDGQGGVSSSVILIDVNAPPNAIADIFVGTRNTSTRRYVLDNDSDPNYDFLTISATSNGSFGSTSFDDGYVTYTPTNPSWFGSDSFTYTVSDGHGGTGTGSVTVTYSANAHPIAIDDLYRTSKDSPLTIDPRDNDADPNGDPIVISMASGGSNGSVTFLGDSVTYSPNVDYIGSDAVTYTITDGAGGSATATISFVVTDNRAPIAQDDADFESYEVRYQEMVTPSSTIAVLDNDSDPDSGDSLSIYSYTQGAYGTVTISGVSLVYQMNNSVSAGWYSDSFTYVVTDGQGGFDQATVTVSYQVVELDP
ncbi:MAG: Ig-like domain-containing protein [Caulobacter sp.]